MSWLFGAGDATIASGQQRYYYAEEGEPEPEIPECLMSAHYVPSSRRQTLDEYTEEHHEDAKREREGGAKK